jgi:hypothetical protein
MMQQFLAQLQKRPRGDAPICVRAIRSWPLAAGGLPGPALYWPGPSTGLDPLLAWTLYLSGSTSKAGCLGAMARSWSSLESGPVPSKKIPTSAFHRLR